MAIRLAIESSTPLGSVAVGRGGEVLCEVVAGASARGSEALLPSIDFALRMAGVGRRELDAVVLGAGPGSFTGVRIAAATAKGLVRALGLPLLAFPSLAALAASAGAGERPVCALFDARRGEVYAACYRFPGSARMEVLVHPRVAPLKQVLAEVPDGALFVGDGALRSRAAVDGAGGEIAPAHLAVPRASALLWLADLQPDDGVVREPGSWEPLYLRGSGAERGVQG